MTFRGCSEVVHVTYREGQNKNGRSPLGSDSSSGGESEDTASAQRRKKRRHKRRGSSEPGGLNGVLSLLAP